MKGKEKRITTISGNIVDVLNSEIYPGILIISNGRIMDILKDNRKYNTYILPGFIDSHIHIESSLLPPSEFARLAVIHGTVATVSDPHEIANVLGVKGINYMIENGETVPFKFFFGASSCVPATKFETSGARLGLKEIERLLRNKKIKYLSEVMNYPGVINQDPKVLAKINLTKKFAKVIDGHAPGLKGETLKKYVKAGISTDHECFTKEEALEKIKLGVRIQIREGSAAKNFDTLASLISDYTNLCMFCSDDKHPNDLVQGHINKLVKKALNLGFDKMKILQCACVNPVKHYGLEVGLLQKNDFADFVVIDNFKKFKVLQTFIQGKLVAENGETLLPKNYPKIVNNFRVRKKEILDFAQEKRGEMINIIEAVDGQLVTNKIKDVPKISRGYAVSDSKRDILKIVVVNRYRNTLPSIGFIKNFALKKGAIASSVAHDSHNIVAMGVSNGDIKKAVNLVIENKGGLSVVCNNICEILPLPIAGLMSDKDGFAVAREYYKLDSLTKRLGSKLTAPFMTLSFMSLLVIPKLKLSDKGLFNSEKFRFLSVFED